MIHKPQEVHDSMSQVQPGSTNRTPSGLDAFRPVKVETDIIFHEVCLRIVANRHVLRAALRFAIGINRACGNRSVDHMMYTSTGYTGFAAKQQEILNPADHCGRGCQNYTEFSLQASGTPGMKNQAAFFSTPLSEKQGISA